MEWLIVRRKLMLEINFDLWFVFKRGWRSVSKNKARVLPVIIVLIGGIAGGSAMISATTSNFKTYEHAWDQMNLADLWINLTPINYTIVTAELNNLTSFPMEYDLRLVVNTQVEFNGKNESGYVVGLDWDAGVDINIPLVDFKPIKPSDIGEGDMIVEEQYAKSKSMKNGDELHFFIGGKKVTKAIDKRAYASDYSFIPSSEKYWLPSLGNLPVIFIDLSTLQTLYDNGPVVNQILVDLPPILEHIDITSYYETSQNETNLIANIVSIIPKETYPSYFFIKEDYESDKDFSYIISGLMFLVAMIILQITASQQVEHEKKEIGALRAIGATSWEVMSAYLLFGAVVGVIGCFGGSILSIILGWVFVQYIAQVFPFIPDLKYYISFTSIGILCIMAFLGCIVSVISSAYRAAKITPQSAIRPETQYYSRKSLIERFGSYFKLPSLSPEYMYATRKFFSRKAHSLLKIGALSLVMMLFVVALAFNSSIQYTEEKSFVEYETWDVSVALSNYTDNTILKQEFNGIQDVTRFEVSITDFTGLFDADGELVFVKLFAYEDNTKMHSFGLKKGDKFSSEDNSIILSAHLVTIVDKDVGEIVYAVARNGTKIPLKISGISSEFIESTIFTSVSTAGILLNQTGKANAMLFQSSNPEATKQVLESYTLVENVQTLTEVRASFDALLGILDVVIFIGMILMILMAAGFTAALMALSIRDKADDLATMKAVGIRRREIFLLQMVETGLLALLCGFLGLFVGIEVTHWMLQYMTKSIASLEYFYSPIDMGITWFLFIVSLVLGNLLPLQGVFRKNLATLTREKIIG